MTAYYNEIDPYAAQWLRNLIDKNLIAPGDVDERSILDVRPSDLIGYTQRHFFAGIGVWSYAARRAGWPDDRPIWTGSCPCQPFSAAGKGGGFADERHLWPAWHHLIRECGPENVFGEQVASKDGLRWLDLVSSDMEGTGYAFWPVDLCAAGVGAPHIRQRNWFTAIRLADAPLRREPGWIRERGSSERAEVQIGGHCSSGFLEHASGHGRLERRAEPSGRGLVGGCGNDGLADSIGSRLEGWNTRTVGNEFSTFERNRADDVRLADPNGGQSRQTRHIQSSRQHGLVAQDGGTLHRGRPGPTNGPWGDADWLRCRDGRWRPVEPGTFPLAHGASSRVGRLRAYGNAIVAQVAETVVATYLEAEAARFEPLRTIDIATDRSLSASAFEMIFNQMLTGG